MSNISEIVSDHSRQKNQTILWYGIGFIHALGLLDGGLNCEDGMFPQFTKFREFYEVPPPPGNHGRTPCDRHLRKFQLLCSIATSEMGEIFERR